MEGWENRLKEERLPWWKEKWCERKLKGRLWVKDMKIMIVIPTMVKYRLNWSNCTGACPHAYNHEAWILASAKCRLPGETKYICCCVLTPALQYTCHGHGIPFTHSISSLLNVFCLGAESSETVSSFFQRFSSASLVITSSPVFLCFPSGTSCLPKHGLFKFFLSMSSFFRHHVIN